jgi:hypothetical protein
MIANRYISNKKFDLECGDSLPGIKIKYHVSSLNRDNKKLFGYATLLQLIQIPKSGGILLSGQINF